MGGCGGGTNGRERRIFAPLATRLSQLFFDPGANSDPKGTDDAIEEPEVAVLNSYELPVPVASGPTLALSGPDLVRCSSCPAKGGPFNESLKFNSAKQHNT